MKTKILLTLFMLFSLLSVNAFAQDFPVTVLKGHREAVTSVAFSPDGNTIASGSWDETIRLWDANTGELINTLTGHTASVNSVRK